MMRSSSLTIFVFAACLVLLMTTQGRCDVSPGDVLDTTNWENAAGLVPDELLDWIKKGDFVLEVGELNFKPGDLQPAFALESLHANRGKYEVSEDDWIVEKATGEPPKHIIGYPFPEIDTDHPKAATKMMHNFFYTQALIGNLVAPHTVDYIKKSFFSRSIESLLQNMMMDGNPECLARRNPDRVIKYQMVVAKSPLDIAGSAVLTWRYFDPQKEDNTFSYVPAIRRVRRMSSGNRSDAMMGTDMAIDDASGYDGKVAALEWKFLRKQMALVPFASAVPTRLVKGERGRWQTPQDIEVMVYGHQKEGWQGATWAPVNWLWVKMLVYVVEAKAKDPYYNYGIQHIWLLPENWRLVYKTIYDKAGQYWKTMMVQARGFESEDNGFSLVFLGDQLMIDERLGHASMVRDASPTNRWTFQAVMDENDFSLAGFQKFCK